MVEKGPILRRATVTNQTTTIGTFASSTGLPPQNNTTSFINESVGIFDGHDQPAGFVGLKTYGISLAGGSTATISYFNNSTIIGSGGFAMSSSVPNNVITNNNAGTSLPTPTGATIYYKMVGYYVTGSVYESFVTVNSPASSTTTNPNTGHTLINTFVATSWTG